MAKKEETTKFRCNYEQRLNMCPRINVSYAEANYKRLISEITAIKKAMYFYKNEELKADTICTPSSKIEYQYGDIFIANDLLYPVLEAELKIKEQYLKNAKQHLKEETDIFKTRCHNCKISVEKIQWDIYEHIEKNPPKIQTNVWEIFQKANDKNKYIKAMLIKIEKECEKLIKIPKYLK